jgi:hypothetical protein
MGRGVSLRDDVEHVLRSWNTYEAKKGAPPVIDFDCHPVTGPVEAAPSRLAVRHRLDQLLTRAIAQKQDNHLVGRLHASLTYLDALLGARLPLREYVKATQGCDAAGWPPDYIAAVGERARKQLADLGVPWGADTPKALELVEEPLAPDNAPDVIRKMARDMESTVRLAVESDAPFELDIEYVDLDVYWAYWLDGAGSRVRMRINARRASFTLVQARQFALHEILGHGLQCASFTQRCADTDVPWVRLTSVHAQQQVLLEGLAQTLPLFVSPHDQRLVARVRLAHYLELVRSELHRAINGGASVPECIALARRWVPFWTNEGIGDTLSDRGVNPLLRSYLWAYPAGIDWFSNLADQADRSTAGAVLRAAYRAPLTPAQLADLWPAGPRFGGAGQSTNHEN